MRQFVPNQMIYKKNEGVSLDPPCSGVGRPQGGKPPWPSLLLLFLNNKVSSEFSPQLMEQYKFGKIVDYEGTVIELEKFLSLELNEPTGKV